MTVPPACEVPLRSPHVAPAAHAARLGKPCLQRVLADRVLASPLSPECARRRPRAHVGVFPLADLRRRAQCVIPGSRWRPGCYEAHVPPHSTPLVKAPVARRLRLGVGLAAVAVLVVNCRGLLERNLHPGSIKIRLLCAVSQKQEEGRRGGRDRGRERERGRGRAGERGVRWDRTVPASWLLNTTVPAPGPYCPVLPGGQGWNGVSCMTSERLNCYGRFSQITSPGP